MSEYISRDTILKVLADREPKEEDWRIDNAENYDLRKIRFLAASNVYEEIKDVLSCDRLLADVALVVHAHWKYERDEGHSIYTGECSVCGYRRRIDQFCGNCGAKMDEDESEDTCNE